MITVHHLEQSRSQRILWLLEELGLDYQITAYKRDPETNLAPEALKKFHSLGKSPILEDGTLILPETGAIIEYLLQKYGGGKFRPAETLAADHPDKVRYLFWMHFAEGSVMPSLVTRLIMNKIAEAPLPFFAKPIAKKIASTVTTNFVNPTIENQFNHIETELGQSAFIASNEFTGADIMMSFPLEAALLRGAIGNNRPNIAAYVEKLQARPAYLKALSRGGPYEYGPPEYRPTQ